jgi:hypothetical protein
LDAKLDPILAQSNDKMKKLVDVDISNGIFIEIKAYHGSTMLGEKEVLQAFNYAAKGGKALLITTGSFTSLDTFEIINRSHQNAQHNFDLGYVESSYKKFVKTVKNKFRKMAKKLDYNISQDSFDARGIYISSGSKLDKMYKYTADWPKEIEYEKLTSPSMIMNFFNSPVSLGLVEPLAFEQLLHQRKLQSAAHLFKRIYETYIEEIMINPPLLYPREKIPFSITARNKT